MKPIEQIAIRVANTIAEPYISYESLTTFATKFLEQWLAQQTPSSYQELADAFVLLWSSDDRAARDKKAVEHFDALLAKVESGYLAPTATPEGWISVEDKLPHTGDLCLICINGVRQNEVYMFDCADSGDYSSPYFWSRDDLDECPIMSPSDLWQPLPPPPGEKK